VRLGLKATAASGPVMKVAYTLLALATLAVFVLAIARIVLRA